MADPFKKHHYRHPADGGADPRRISHDWRLAIRTLGALAALAWLLLAVAAPAAVVALGPRRPKAPTSRARSSTLTDALTGMGNRRRLMQDLERATAAAVPGEPWLLVIFDLNGFKRYNDTSGIRPATTCWRAWARRSRARCRATWRPCSMRPGSIPVA